MTEHDLNEGDVVRARKVKLYNSDFSPDIFERDGWYHVRIISEETDVGNDLRCWELDSNGKVLKRNYVKASSAVKVTEQEMPWDTAERDRDHEVDDDETEDEVTDISVLDEEQERLVGMQELKARTIAPNVLELPVSRVTATDGNNKWSIIVEHPTLGEMVFHENDPVTGWTDEYRIVNLLDSYGIYDADPYKLQQKEVYVEFTGDSPDITKHWDLKKRDVVVEEYIKSDNTDNIQEKENNEPGITAKAREAGVSGVVMDFFELLA